MTDPNKMATSSIPSGALVAHVRFRVRCEKLGHGEAVFLVRSDDPTMSRPVPLYTTGSSHPWYSTVVPVAITLPSPESEEEQVCQYRYAVFRAGVFFRWEEPADAPPDDDLEMDVTHHKSFDDDQFHQLPLKSLKTNETYTVDDLLGFIAGPPAIDHVVTPTSSPPARRKTVLSHGSMHSMGSGTALAGTSNAAGRRKKQVGFAPVPPPYHPKSLPGSLATKQAVHLDSTDGLVVVSVFLPVHLNRSDDGRWNAEWDYEALLSMQTHLRVTRVGVVKWRGWHGNQGPDGSPEMGVPVMERENVEACLRPFNCVPVWVEPTLFGEMYNGFCKGVLWPILHHVTSVYSSRRQEGDGFQESARAFDSDADQFSHVSTDDVGQGPIHGDGGREADLWGAYNSVNREFANVVVQCFTRGDLVWVHGFHLMVLPSYLTRRIPMAKVGLFLHTPFPSSEIFRTVWCREDLLRGMLNADQVGFHVYEYARHFLTCCRRLLGLNYGMIPDASGGYNLAIDSNGRHVTVTSIHAGIEPPVLNHILTHGGTLEKALAIRNQYKGKIVFCAIDRIESLKGIPLKLLGLQRFLQRCPEFADKIVLVQVGISAYERPDDYSRTKQEVVQMVNKINQSWPGTVQFQECGEGEMKLQQRMSLLRAADVALVTPIRDGLNLTPLEFTLAHQDALTDLGKADGRKRGLCILSEFSSCTRVMRGALHVNPWKVSEIANAFYLALTMSEEERMRRISTASEFVTRVTTQRWALAVMLDLKGVSKNENTKYAAAGLGLGYRLLGMDAGFQSLDTNAVAKLYRNARARLIFLDYGGTISSNDNLDNMFRFQFVKKARETSVPTEEMLAAVKELCADKKNTVFVVSGKERHSLTKTLNHIPNLGLAAEHGFFISWPTSRVGAKRRWETIVPEQDTSWRSIAITIMEVYTSRTHGSYIEETEMKVLWQYRDADPEFGYLQARELEDHLSNVLRSFAVDILHGGMKEGGYVEVRPKGVNKGVLAMRVMQRFPAISLSSKVDFALVLGDDHCDEPMLSIVRQIGRRAIEARRVAKGEEPLPEPPATMALADVSSCDEFVSPDLEVVTCTVGQKPSAAASYLHDVDEVLELLESLGRLSARVGKFHSSVDLRSYHSGGDAFASMKRLSEGDRPLDLSFQQQFLSLDPTQTISAGVTRAASLGEMKKGREDKAVSNSLRGYLEKIDDTEDDPDDDPFFF